MESDYNQREFLIKNLSSVLYILFVVASIDAFSIKNLFVNQKRKILKWWLKFDHTLTKLNAIFNSTVFLENTRTVILAKYGHIIFAKLSTRENDWDGGRRNATFVTKCDRQCCVPLTLKFDLIPFFYSKYVHISKVLIFIRVYVISNI